MFYIFVCIFRLESGSEEEKEKDPEKEKEKEKEKKTDEKPSKSIYSDDEEENAPKKNFEGELKPGLNRVGLHFNCTLISD